MSTVTIQFVGICTLIEFDQIALPPTGHRIVLANGNELAILENHHLSDALPPIPPHHAILSVPATSTIDGPASTHFFPLGPDLLLHLNIEKMESVPPQGGLRGATLRVAGITENVSPFGSNSNCIPHLSRIIPDVRPGPHVTDQDAAKVSAYFDILVGQIEGRIEPNTGLEGQAFSQLEIVGYGTPQITITPWDGGDPTIVTLPDEGATVVVSNSPPFDTGADDNHFLLHFVTTDDQWPPSNGMLDIVTTCPGGTIYSHGEGGPGCSNSNLP